jgi:site-specific DNA-adenine methylase
MEVLQAPFPWFGGKSKVAPLVWQRFGTVRNFVEPFFGSGAVLLGRPQPFEGPETINDKDGYVANLWRAIQHAPDEVANWADSPVNENDLHARHAWLVERKAGFAAKLEGDPEFFDAKVAGWWLWGCCCWIGSGWCSGNGPWGVVEDEEGNRQLVHLGDAGQGVNRQLVHLGDAGQGVNRQLVHLGDAGQGVNRQLVHLGDAGRGVNRKRVHLGNADEEQETISRKRPLITNDSVSVANADGVLAWMLALAERLSRVRVCCGDWERVCGPTPTIKQGLTAVFLDPPYSSEADRAELYTEEDFQVAHKVREWCLKRGDDTRIRVALCGYAGEGHEELEANGWTVEHWKARGGFASQAADGKNENARKERIWFSPHCITARQRSLEFEPL